MSTILGFRSFNRGSKWSLGDKTVSTTNTILVNIDNARVRRDIARHSAIGQLLQVIPPFYQADDGVVDQGGKVAVRATGLVLDVGAVNFTRATAGKGSGAKGTVTVTSADVTNPRIDTVVVDTTAGTYSVLAGTATAGANAFNLSGKASLPANRIVLAYVVVPATATNLTASAVLDARP